MDMRIDHGHCARVDKTLDVILGISHIARFSQLQMLY